MPALYPYPAYKPSGVEWLGYVPEYWDLVRLKYAVQINPETLSEDTDPEYLFDYMDINSVGTGYMATPPVRQVFGNAPSRARRVFRQGDTAVSTVRTYLRAAYHLERDWPHLIASTGFAVLRPAKTIVPALLGHIVQSDAFVRQVVTNSVGVAYPAISETRLDTLFLVLPPLQEQTSIVRYLDHVDRRVRRYVSAKRKLIALLEEEKRAVINRAVTRGLDPNVRLKPSGVEWLGDVPNHWKVCKLKQCGTISGGMTPSMEVARFWGGSIPWVTPKDMKQDVINSSSLQITDSALQETSIRLIDPPAVLVVVRGMILARRVPIAWTSASVTINQDMKALKVTKGTNAVFIARLLYSAQDALTPLIDQAGHGTRRLPTERWREVDIAMPPEHEQAEIVEYIDSKITKIASNIVRARRQIEIVQEYRTRLIADVVTGKLDVREAAALLPDEAVDEESMDEGGPLADSVAEGLYDPDESVEGLAMESEVTV